MEREKVNDEVIYISIDNFNANTADNLELVLDQAKEDGIKGIVFDVRNNPGGYLDQGIEACRMLMPYGPIIHTVRKNGDEMTYYSYLDSAPFKTVVLVNENSASCAEIFAGALQDSKVGVLVGEKTFGKGVVQVINNLPDGSAYKLTVEEYLTPNKTHINNIGIEPDYKVVIPNYVVSDKKLKREDENESVKLLEEVLYFLGYDTGDIDNVYDYSTEKAVSKFQKDNKLYAYGVADFTTMKYINEKLVKKVEENDPQLKKAYEIINELIK